MFRGGAQPQQADWIVGPVECYRRIVVDLITVIGQRALPVYLLSDVDMSWSTRLKARFASEGLRLTETAILLKSIGIAQKHQPETKAISSPFAKLFMPSQTGAGFTVEKFVGSSPAVFFGCITSPDSKSLSQIMLELHAYAESKITAHPQLALQKQYAELPWLVRRLLLWLAILFPGIRLRMVGATFGLSSLGKYGIQAITGPCICTTTFGVGTSENRVVVKDGIGEVRPQLTLSLAFDSRVLTCDAAASFLREVKELVEGGLQSYLGAEALGGVREIANS